MTAPTDGDDRADMLVKLRDALARAESGLVVAVAISEVHLDGEIATSFSAGEHWAPLIGAVAMVKHRLLSEVP